MFKRIKQIIPELLWLLAFICLSFALNTQLKSASNIHANIGGHDEYLSVREVYSILNAPTAKHFVAAVSLGDKLYYGRMMFYFDAAVAYIPYKIWGVEGMVVAIRMMQSFVMALAFLLLGLTFIKNRINRFLFLATVSFGSYTWYFLMMPKPEPYQLLFLVLFFIAWNKSKFTSAKAFLWLGLAYGCKFNVLPLLPLFLAIQIWQLLKSAIDKKATVKPILLTFFWLGFGFVIAIPGLLLIPLNPAILHNYLDQTFYFVAQSYDDPNVNAMSWLKGIYGFYFWGHNYLIALFFFLYICTGIWIIMDYIRTREIVLDLIIFITASAFFFPVILFTHRLWPHYLWTSHVLFMLLFFIKASAQFNKSRLQLFYNGALLCGVVYFVSIFNLRHAGSFFGLDKEFAGDKQSWEKARKYIVDRKKEAIVLQTNLVWYPFTEFVKINPFNPFHTALAENNTSVTFNWNLTEKTPEAELMRSDYLIVKSSFADKDLEGNQRALMHLVERDFRADTAFGGYVIYGKKNQPGPSR